VNLYEDIRKNKRFFCLLNLVIHDCNREIIELLLNNGANPECEDKSTNTTALQMAVIRGNLLTTQLLINYGANPRKLSKVELKKQREFCFRYFFLGGWKNSSRISFCNKSNGKKRNLLLKSIIKILFRI
jgi:ankyrin repeat protein